MKTFLILLVATLQSLAQPNPEISQLFETRDAKEFSQALLRARKNGVSQQTILEARFLYNVDQNDLQAIAKMSEEFLQFADSYKPENSQIFAQKEDWLAVVEYTQAIDALLANNEKKFKKHITEAFWLSPRQASAFAPHIEKLHLEKAMRSIVIPETLELTVLDTKKQNTLEQLRNGNKATLLHFWSPWSRESDESIADFIATAGVCAANGVAVVSILAEQDPEIEKDATDFIKTRASAAKSAWTRDNPDTPLARTLRIQNLPTFVLLSSEGKVLFNGHPSEKKLWRRLQQISPKITRPGR